jgi:hypothetical protein
MRCLKGFFSTAITLVMIVPCAFGGGPLVTGGPNFGVDGQPFTWDVASMPIQYRVDGGPLSKGPGGGPTVDNASGLARLQTMLAIWQNVSTASVRFQFAGSIQPTGSFAGGDVASAADFNAVYGACNAGQQTPIIFDANGSIVSELGLPPDIIGFASPCKLDAATGHIVTGFALLNGEFQDNVSQGANFELTASQFDEAITHELGHLLGLDHSQINASVLDEQRQCSVDKLAGLPLMFPFAYCQSRADAGLPVLAPDDKAWISKFYPTNTTAANYGTISGVVYFSDGITPAQGVNVIARRVDDTSTNANESLRIAVSVVSGYLFTGNPGQSVTSDNVKGDSSGSRNPQLIGFYEIPVPPGTYTVEVESIRSSFEFGSRVGPLDPPAPNPGRPEFWDKNESAFDKPAAFDTVTVGAGESVKGIDFVLNGTPTRFDQFEDGIFSLLWHFYVLPERKMEVLA